MSSTQSAVLVGFLAFLGVVLAPIITNFINQQHERNKERHDYIQGIVTDLINIRGDLQYYQYPDWELRNGVEILSEVVQKETFQKMQIAYGKAYAIMISVDIKEIRDKAPDIMKKESNENPSLKLAAIDFALERLGKEYQFFNRNDSESFSQ
jgi:hypothetical protein